ncbi:hypothetical protein HDE_13711 [Halotydeus destructor]|nr:hypothetical protein HDE_13711 [Halotydeus destructor]
MNLLFLIVSWTTINSCLAQQDYYTLVNCLWPDGSGPDAIVNQGDHFIVFRDNKMAKAQLRHGELPVLISQPKKIKLIPEFDIAAATAATLEDKLIVFGVRIVPNNVNQIWGTILYICWINKSLDTDCQSSLFPKLSKSLRIFSAEKVGNQYVLIASDDTSNPIKKSLIVANLTDIISETPLEAPVASLPNAMTLNKQGNASILIYDYVYTTSVQNNITSAESYLMNSANRFRLSQLWLGCPTEFCFDAQLDSAMRSWPASSRITVRRGFYSWTINLDSMQLSKPSTTSFLTDAICKDSSYKLYIFRDSTVSNGSFGSNESIAAIFGLEISFIDAAFVYEEDMYIIVEETVYVYRSLNQIENFKYQTRWRGLPDNIDAATVGVKNGVTWVYFFRDDLFYTVIDPTGSQLVNGPYLMQTDMISCPDTFYNGSKFTEALNITSLDDFVKYKSQFESKIATTTLSSPSSDFTSETNLARKKTRSKLIPYLIALVLACLIVAILIVIVNCRKVAKKKIYLGDVGGPTNNTSVDPVSNETTTVSTQERNTNRPSTKATFTN